MAKGDVDDPWIISQGGGDDFTNLNNCLQDVGVGDNDYIEIQGVWTAADTSSGIHVEDSNLSISCVGLSRHAGYIEHEASGTGHYRLRIGTGHVIEVDASNPGTIFDGMIIENTAAGVTNSDECIRFNSDMTAKNCIFLRTETNSSQGDGLYHGLAGLTLNLENCIIMDCGRVGIHHQGKDNGVTNINSCSLYECANGAGAGSDAWGGIGLSTSSNVTINAFNTWILECDDDGYVNADDYNRRFGSGQVFNIYNCLDSDNSITLRDVDAQGSISNQIITDDATKIAKGNWVIVNNMTTEPYDLRLVESDYNAATKAHNVNVFPPTGMLLPSFDIAGNSRDRTEIDIGAHAPTNRYSKESTEGSSYVTPRHLMPELLIPGRKPTGPVEIDWEHPLTEKLKGVYLFQPGARNYNHVTKRFEIETWDTAPKYVAGGIEQVNTDDDYLIKPVETPDQTLGLSAYISVYNSAASQTGYTQPLYFDDKFVYSWNHAVAAFRNAWSAQDSIGYITAQGTSAAGYLETLGTFKAGNALRCYEQNALQNEEVSTGSAATITTGQNSFISPLGSINDGFVGPIFCIMYWERELSASEAIAFLADPYQFLIPAIGG
jgi:hypothetical protein